MAEQRMILEDGRQTIAVHFVAPLPGLDGLRVVCSPLLTELGAVGGRPHSWHLITTEVGAVTCPLCRESAPYRQAAAALAAALGARRAV